MNISQQIEDIIEDNGSDFELSKLFKQYIQEYKASLGVIFEKNQGKDFLVKHTKKLDSIIELMYKTVLRRTFGNYLPMRNNIPVAIVALGSYGREQLCVHSDIDLLIVYEEVNGYNSELIIEKLFYLALDAGLKLGHRVHETKDLFKAANEDLTIRTALMESRFICGSTFTWHAAQRQLQKIRTFKQKEFILQKIHEAQVRRKKYPLSMEPNIKEGVGALRDAQLIFWIANTIYGITNIKVLSEEVFSDESYREFRIALELLFRVRSALHLATGKQEDTLRLEYIPQIAQMLGFKDQKKLAAKVLEALWRVSNFTQIFVKKMVRPYLYDKHSIAKLRTHKLQKGFYLLDNRIYASYKMQARNINELLEILVALDDKDYSFDAGFLSQFTYTKVKHPLSKRTYALLKKLLQREHVFSFLKLFYDSGVLSELFSNFKKVTHLPQFDGYHHFPVDYHSIKCVEALENIREPFIKELYNTLNEQEKLILKVVVLFHDTGKGRKQDHSEVGAKLIAHFVKHLNFTPQMEKRAVTLVRYHILMSSIAFKQNIHNEKTLYRFMSVIEDETNLKLLYIHTYADINGVDGIGGKTYNTFNANLLNDLYINALEVAQNKERITDAKKRLGIEKKVRNLEEFKALPKLLQNKIFTIVSNLFFFKHTPKDIVQIAKIARDTKEYSFRTSNNDTLTIEIFRRIPLNVAYMLSRLTSLDVGSMEIFTLFDDLKYFKIEFTQKVDENVLIQIEEMIDEMFDMSKEPNIRDVEIKEEEITLDCEHSLTHAEITIQTKNQKGLLAFMIAKFEQLDLNIVSAKIHSRKYKVRDSFLVAKENKTCDNIKRIYEELITKKKEK